MSLHGQPVSPGIVIGRAAVFAPQALSIEESSIEAHEVETALVQFEKARETAGLQLAALQECLAITDAEQAGIFEAQREMLFDEVISEMVRENIEENAFSLEYAIECTFNFYAKLLAKTQDARIGARSADIQDVKNRLLRVCRGETAAEMDTGDEPVILIAQDLLPSDTVSLDKSRILAIVTQDGNATSHSAILANALAIPAVVGVSNAMEQISNGMQLIVDAVAGEVFLQPEELQIASYQKKQERFLRESAVAAQYLMAPALTHDGTNIEIGLNIGSPKDLESCPRCYDSVGLLRSEFLYMNHEDFPDEEEQYQAYCCALEKSSAEVTLRTLDIGGDKDLPYFQMQEEKNPFLGQRALRLCFARPDIFRTQLRAALRAAVKGPLRIMLPMVTCIEDIRKAKQMMEQVRQELLAEGVACAEMPKVGVMIEVPAAALMADQIADLVDFASVGTNDLCQYLMAADRGNPEVATYYQYGHPAFLRLLKYVFESFARAGQPVSVCGEMAGDEKWVQLLVGLGARKLSMSQSRIGWVKQSLCTHTLMQMEDLANQALLLSTAEEVGEYLQRYQHG